MPSPLLLAITPLTRTMDDLDLATLWQNRRHWVFKPITSHGGKGVLFVKMEVVTPRFI
ncbi:MAG: hypothetical protein HW380_1757 [Magnetococcales bacterium]|nr:hypothetical protein [Magnetococcales bacterium]